MLDAVWDAMEDVANIGIVPPKKGNGGSKPPPYIEERIATRVGTGLPDGPQKHSHRTVEDAGPYRYAMTWWKELLHF